MKIENKKIEPFQFMILILSIYILLALFVESVFDLPTEISRIIQISDNIICLLLLIDFFVRLIFANNKLKFLKWGWIDLISSIPTVDILRYARLSRLFRIFRVLRSARSTKVLISHLFASKMKGTFASVSAISVILVVFSSIAILNVENFPNSNIQTAEEAIWWSLVTITTVGYGDYYPVSIEGRMVAGILIVAGVGLFGTFTGFVASWFLEEQGEQQEMKVIKSLQADIAQLNSKIERLETLLVAQISTKEES